MLRRNPRRLPAHPPPASMDIAAWKEALAKISYDTPWTVSLDGRALGPYPAYSEMINSKKRPNLAEHADWSTARVMPLLEEAPDAVDAIWECVLALWRLSRLADDCVDPEWPDYVSAWLVRRLLLRWRTCIFADKSVSSTATAT